MTSQLTVAVMVAAVASFDASPAASTDPGMTVDAIIRDCATDGELNQSYDLTVLRRAQDRLPADIRQYTECEDVIGRAPSRATGTVNSVIRDCARHGRLTRGYRVDVLRQARHRLPADVRTYTVCERLITRAVQRASHG